MWSRVHLLRFCQYRCIEQLSYSQKRIHTLSVEGTKNPETRAKRVLKAIEALVAK